MTSFNELSIAQRNTCYELLINDYKRVLDEIQKAYDTCEALGTTMCIYILRDYNKKLANIDSLITKIEVEYKKIGA